MTKNGLPLEQFELPERIDTGIEIRSLDGVVPEFECREAAKFSGYTYSEWRTIHYMERAAAIAFFRLHYKIEAFNSKAIENRMNSRRR